MTFLLIQNQILSLFTPLFELPGLFVPFVIESNAFSNTERLFEKQIELFILREILSHFEIKPPAIGNASRIDDCSLSDVTTCCQIVFASRLVLFGLRL
jgi:hypothetical protein